MPVGSRHLLIVGCSGRARGARRAGAADLALSRLAARRGRDDNERYFGPQRWPVFVTVANAPAEPPRTLRLAERELATWPRGSRYRRE